MSIIKYRPEIDGLRTIAVLSVIIYHADFFLGKHQVLQGGFFGVDVFFVISGFLITSLITKELNTTGKFSFLHFYDRRARRLLPVLLVIFFVSYPFAWHLLLPESFVDYAKSIIASNIFLSNFYWYDSLQVYGAESSNLKPFLHTWSLAVEEQYYFIFPIILIAAVRWFKLNVIGILTLLILLSLQFAEIMSSSDSSFSFYMLISRFWELLIGSLLAYTLYIHPARENDTLLTKIMPSVGIYLILYSIVFIDYNSSNHPGFITLLPVVGTVLIIWFSNKNELVTKILSSKLLVSIGLISYSLYLWHYPIFAFLRIGGYFDEFLYKALSILLVFVLSFISYKLIEQPFRSQTKIPAKPFYVLLIVSIISILFISNKVVSREGYLSRYKEENAIAYKEMKIYRAKYWGDKSAYTKVLDFTKENYSVEVIGNSWAQDVANSLIENSNYEVSFSGTTGHHCKAITLNRVNENNKGYLKWEEKCTQENPKRFKSKLPNTDLVIIADDGWLQRIDNKEIANETLKNIDLLRKNGYQGPIMILSNRPTYRKPVFLILKEYDTLGSSINKIASKYMRKPLHVLKSEDKKASIFYNKNKVYYYSLVNALCSDKDCKIVHDGMPLYHDWAHLTLSGTKYVGADLVTYINNNIKESWSGKL